MLSTFIHCVYNVYNLIHDMSSDRIEFLIFILLQVLEDWKYVARVIDRLLLYIFLVVTIGGTAGILLKAPHIFESVKQEDILGLMNRNWARAKSR